MDDPPPAVSLRRASVGAVASVASDSDDRTGLRLWRARYSVSALPLAPRQAASGAHASGGDHVQRRSAARHSVHSVSGSPAPPPSPLPPLSEDSVVRRSDPGVCFGTGASKQRQRSRLRDHDHDRDKVGPRRCCSPRHRMSLISEDEGSKCVSMTWEQHLPGPNHRSQRVIRTRAGTPPSPQTCSSTTSTSKHLRHHRRAGGALSTPPGPRRQLVHPRVGDVLSAAPLLPI